MPGQRVVVIFIGTPHGPGQVFQIAGEQEKLASVYGCIGIHNRAWSATPYLEAYAQVPGVGYIDLGIKSDLAAPKVLFPAARRAVMYTPMDAANKTMTEIEADFERLAREYAPCDVVIADIEAGTADARVVELVELCKKLSSPTRVFRIGA